MINLSPKLFCLIDLTAKPSSRYNIFILLHNEICTAAYFLYLIFTRNHFIS